MKVLIMTHDLACTLGQLAVAACRYPNGATTDITSRPAQDLVIAAVAFTIQLAIDEADRDPAEMRVLESALFAALERVAQPR